MPRSGVPYRAYFFGRTSVTWFDGAPDGTRSWSSPKGIEEVWPALTDVFPDTGVPPDTVYGTYPVSSTVVRVAGRYLDVAKGALVPDPRNVTPHNFIRPDGTPVKLADAVHLTSWDVGPILLFTTEEGPFSTTVCQLDVRDYSLGPTWSTFDRTSHPTIAIPGEPVRWFTSDDPQQVVCKGVGDLGIIFKDVAEVFPQLPLDRIVDATVVYGPYRQVLADATAELSDDDVRVINDLSAELHDSGEVQGEDLLAVLHLLSGLRQRAYHPEGFFGIAQMSGQQLRLGGWTDPPESILEAPVREQIEVLRTYIRTFRTFPTLGGEVAPLVMACAGRPDILEFNAVVARAPYPPRLRNLAPVSADGTISDTVTVGDLRAKINDVLSGPLERELRCRAAETSLA